MLIFKRSIIAEIISYTGITLFTLIIIWLSILLMRLLGEVSKGNIEIEILAILVNFSIITALPIILTISLFISILATVTRNCIESEMIIWISNGLSLFKWINPILTVSLPIALLVAALTLIISPWSYDQINKYRNYYGSHSQFSKLPKDEFIEFDCGKGVLFIENAINDSDMSKEYESQNIFVKISDYEGLSILSAKHLQYDINQNNESSSFILSQGHRYDIKLKSNEARIIHFDKYIFPLYQKLPIIVKTDKKNEAVDRSFKNISTASLIKNYTKPAQAQIIWRISIPLATINLAILAIPLGSIHFSNKISGQVCNFLIATLISLIYINLINFSCIWISSGKIKFYYGFLVHIALSLASFLLILISLYKKQLLIKG
ncbi:MAG: LPS export ABC transporter permease LptF [Bordetella sp.]|nr:MAG: LPS export ABC transporter permease LptF [Bordetella sp.]